MPNYIRRITPFCPTFMSCVFRNTILPLLLGTDCGGTNHTGKGDPAEVFGLLLWECVGGSFMRMPEMSTLAVPHGAGIHAGCAGV